MTNEEFHNILNTICENGYAHEAWKFFNSLREDYISQTEKMLREAQATLRIVKKLNKNKTINNLLEEK